MLVLQLAAILLLMSFSTFAPGFFVVRQFRWSAMEKLCGSVALSLIFLWLAGWGIYVSGLDFRAVYAVAAVCVGLGLMLLRDIRRFRSLVRIRAVLFGFAFLLGWTLLALTIIRVYNGARWGGDWLEHFQRTLFFLHRFPKDTGIFGNYQLPARPPGENLLAAFFLGLVSDRFELFQIVLAFLNLLVFVPCCLALPLLARSRRFGVLPLVGLFAASPILMQNATYTWTKLLAAFFVISALVFYLKGWRRGDSLRIVFAFLCLAMGMLVHYSAGPYVVFFALHYLIAVFPRRRTKWNEIAVIAGTCSILLATWFGWSIATYGVQTTVASNTSITASQGFQGSNLGKIAGNIADSFVPHVFRGDALVHFFDQPNHTGFLRDNIFIAYQVQLLLTMGIIGGPLVMWLVFRTFRAPWRRTSERAFWLLLIAATVLIGLAVVGERDQFGSAHLTLLPVELLGLTWLATAFCRWRMVAMLLIAGCAIDFALGVFLHLRVEHLENTPERVVFSGPVVANGQVVLIPTPDALSDAARENWSRKHQLANSLQWKRELEANPAPVAGKTEAIAMLDGMIADDSKLFRGWYARHGGEVEYLGDHFGDSDVTSALLVVFFAGLLWKMSREIPARQVVAPVKSKAARVRSKR